MVMRTVQRSVGVVFVGVVFIGTALSGCTSEDATVIDLDAVTTTSTATSVATDSTGSSMSMAPFTDEVDPDDPNAEARQQVIDAARQQCLDDPELDEGVVRLVIAESGELANEYRVDCDEVRAEEG